jgi:ribosomal protein L37AE/L43A
MDENMLEDRLVRLGDMMGDGLHLEPEGKWIEKEYKKTLKALGLLEPVKRNSNSEKINEFMVKRLKEVKCTCGSELVQSRSGSFIGKCIKCGKKFILGSRRR